MLEGFQEQVIDRLARLDKWAESIDKHLAQINGTVGRHDKAIIQLREAEAVRVAAHEAREKEAAKYQRWIQPAIRYGVVIAVVELLDRGPQIVAGLKLAGLVK